MNDYATPERRAWIARMQSGQKPANWLLAEPINFKADPTVDAEYKARADKAWAQARREV